MNLYNVAEIALGILIIGLGLFMFIAPEKATKKTLRDNPSAVKRTKRSGVFEMIVGILWLVMCIATMKL